MFPGQQPPQKSRKPLIITLVSVGVVLLVGVIIAVIALSGGSNDGKGGSAGDVVKGYLEALARGDAAAALSYGSGEPGSMDFLTDEILKKQIEKMPITDIKILNDSSKGSISFGQVHVSVKFGNKTSDETLSLKRSGKEWKFENAAIKLDRMDSGVMEKARHVTTLFGSPLPDSAVYVFPGWLDLASSTPNLEVTSNPVLLDGLRGYSSFYNLDVKVGITDAGKRAADRAIRDAVGKCTRTSALAPANCPNAFSQAGAQENSASWGEPDLSDLELSRFSEYSLDVSFNSGIVEFPVTFRTGDGQERQGRVRSYMSGDVDMSQDPPSVDFR